MDIKVTPTLVKSTSDLPKFVITNTRGYESIEYKDINTLYFVEDTNTLYFNGIDYRLRMCMHYNELENPRPAQGKLNILYIATNGEVSYWNGSRYITIGIPSGSVSMNAYCKVTGTELIKYLKSLPFYNSVNNVHDLSYESSDTDLNVIEDTGDKIYTQHAIVPVLKQRKVRVNDFICNMTMDSLGNLKIYGWADASESYKTKPDIEIKAGESRQIDWIENQHKISNVLYNHDKKTIDVIANSIAYAISVTDIIKDVFTDTQSTYTVVNNDVISSSIKVSSHTKDNAMKINQDGIYTPIVDMSKAPKILNQLPPKGSRFIICGADSGDVLYSIPIDDIANEFHINLDVFGLESKARQDLVNPTKTHLASAADLIDNAYKINRI